MKYTALIFIIIMQPCWADELCPVAAPVDTPYNAIHEKFFNATMAIDAADRLKNILSNPSEYDDFRSAVKNNLVWIEGYMLKHNATRALEQKYPNAKNAVDELCKFIATDAHFWH